MYKPRNVRGPETPKVHFVGDGRSGSRAWTLSGDEAGVLSDP